MLGVWAMTAYAAYWIHRDAPHTLGLVARSYSDAGHSDVAAARLKEALKEYPHNPELTVYLLFELFGQGKPAEAEALARETLSFAESNSDLHLELGVVGRPAVMVPLPHALDNDQLNNARSFADGGGGWVRPQAELRPEEFAAFLTRLRYEEAELAQAAQMAAGQGRPDAAERVADLVERLAGQAPKQETGTT